MLVLTNLKRLRERAALSQRDLAKRAKVTAATVIRAEKGLPMRYLTTRRLAEALGVEPSALTETQQ